ncbi:MAG TPA: 30S ribosomal protein S16 [Candidatus Bathyarchaeia archaeon]|nr:30S ribosomal protein S16 [Candidatus Bathyarchaeia archaeon]
MLKIRLTRRGKKNSAFFRVVVAEHTSPIKGGFLEVLGFVNPHTKEKSFKTDRIQYWIGKGAQCSDTVHNLLVSNDVIKGPKRAVRLKKKAASAEAPASQAEEDKADKPEEARPEAKEEKKNEEKEGKKPAEEVKTEERAEENKPEPDKKEDVKLEDE